MNIYKKNLSFAAMPKYAEGDIHISSINIMTDEFDKPAVFGTYWKNPYHVYTFVYVTIGKTFADCTYHGLTVHARNFREALRSFYQGVRLIAGNATEDEAEEIINDRFNPKFDHKLPEDVTPVPHPSILNQIGRHPFFWSAFYRKSVLADVLFAMSDAVRIPNQIIKGL